MGGGGAAPGHGPRVVAAEARRSPRKRPLVLFSRGWATRNKQSSPMVFSPSFLRSVRLACLSPNPHPLHVKWNSKTARLFCSASWALAALAVLRPPSNLNCFYCRDNIISAMISCAFLALRGDEGFLYQATPQVPWRVTYEPDARGSVLRSDI